MSLVVRIWLPKAILHCEVTADLGGGGGVRDFSSPPFSSVAQELWQLCQEQKRDGIELRNCLTLMKTMLVMHSLHATL